MQLTIPPDLDALVQKRLASGAFASVEDVIRRALEAQDEEEGWTPEERLALDRKIERALQQAATGNSFDPATAREKLATLRAAQLARRD